MSRSSSEGFGLTPGCESQSRWYCSEPKNQNLSGMNGPDTWTVASLLGVAVIREALVDGVGRVAAGERVVLEVDVRVAVERVRCPAA